MLLYLLELVRALKIIGNQGFLEVLMYPKKSPMK